MANQSIWDHPIEKLEEALNLKKQIHALQEKLSSMFGFGNEEHEPKRRPGFAPIPEQPTKGKRGGKRVFSAETRAKMAASQQARYATKNSTTSGGASVAPAKSSAKGKRTMSPEARARIAAAQRARWAKSKGTSSSSSTTVSQSKNSKLGKKGKRTMSPETKAKMAAAMKARWAAAKKKGLPGPNARK